MQRDRLDINQQAVPAGINMLSTDNRLQTEPPFPLLDPDRVIEREGLGIAARYPTEILDAVRYLLGDPAAWKAASDRCRRFMAREYGEDKVLAAYLDTFAKVMHIDTAGAGMIVSGKARHV